MNLKQYFAIMVILLIAGVIITLIPAGKPHPEFARIEYVETRALDVNSSHVTLQFSVKVSKPEEMMNLSLIVKFVDVQTNLLISEFSERIPEKTKSDYVAVLVCPVKKNYNYAVRIQLERDGKILSRHEMRMLGLASLPPAEKSVEMTVRDVDFRVLNKTGDFVTVRATYYVETPGNYTVRFHVKAVQLESNVLADEYWETKTLQKGRTNLVSFTLSLRDDYNYRIVLELWNEGYLIDSWKDYLKFNPMEETKEQDKVEKFRVEDFVVEEERTPMPVPSVYREKPLSAPGFEVALAVIAGGVAVWMRRR